MAGTIAVKIKANEAKAQPATKAPPGSRILSFPMGNGGVHPSQVRPRLAALLPRSQLASLLESETARRRCPWAYASQAPRGGKDNASRIQNGKKLNMKRFGMAWYALKLEVPPASMRQQAPGSPRRGFRQKRKGGKR